MMLFNQIKSICKIRVLLLMAMLTTGCKQELTKDTSSASKNVSVQVSVRNATADPDCKITSLRMLVFNANDKSLALSVLFDPVEVYDNVNKNYLLSGSLSNTPEIRLVVIANERADWQLNNGITYDGLQTLKAHYDKEGLSAVESPFLMFVGDDQDIPTPAGTTIERSISLERSVVKITLNLKQKLLQPHSNKTALTFKKLHIEKVPRHGFLTPQQVYSSAEGYTKTAEHNFATTDFELDENYSVLKESLVLYIPEHLLADKANYSRILISASRNSGGEDVTYELPLGNGVDKLYNVVPVAFADLSATDLSCVRNTHFDIDATISLAHVDVAFSVKEWTELNVEGEINNAPYLNISSLEQTMRVLGLQKDENDNIIIGSDGLPFLETNPKEIRFFVWTNLQKEELIVDTLIFIENWMGTPSPLKDSFFYDWVVTETADGSLPGVSTTTGILTLKIRYTPYSGFGRYTMKVSARNLSRNFDVVIPLNPA